MPQTFLPVTSPQDQRNGGLAELVFITVRPNLYEDMLTSLNKEDRQYPSKLWVSIMAGVELSDLTAAIGMVTPMAGRVVRSMPSTPVIVRRGNTAVTFSEGCSSEDRNTIITIFSSLGRCTQLPEKQQNAFSALARSGPAHLYKVIEAMADDGVMMGLPRDLAMEQAASMIEGTAAMVLQAGNHPAAIKEVALYLLEKQLTGAVAKQPSLASSEDTEDTEDSEDTEDTEDSEDSEDNGDSGGEDEELVSILTDSSAEAMNPNRVHSPISDSSDENQEEENKDEILL